jgi:VIT1/CCC1 family predicted Fe2+/Mn2+ transporter
MLLNLDKFAGFVMRHSFNVGLSFGLTSGIITTLGLMIGLYSGTNSQFVVIGGILTIAIADSMSDALGIHIAVESEDSHSSREIWESTFGTFIFKFIVASSFLIPVFLLDLQIAVITCIVWGLSLLGILSYTIAKRRDAKVWRVIGEHLFIAVIVIIVANYVGQFLRLAFMN